MNVLLLTILYHIEGRPDLFHDTSAIHHLVKYWSKDNDVRVLNTYLHSYKQIHRFLDNKKRQDYFDGYSFTKDGVKVQLVEIQKIPGQGGRFYAHQKKRILEAHNKLVDDGFEPDVIIAHFPFASLSYIQQIQDYYGRRIPVVAVLHKTDIMELKRGRLTARLLDDNCAAVFARSKAIFEKAQAYNILCLRDEIISSGVPEAKLDAKPKQVHKELRIIFVGKLQKQKNIDVLINAFSVILKDIDARLEIVGSGKEEKSLRKMADRLGISAFVSFTGKVTREEAIQRMGESDILCMPSKNETLGLVYLEAMSVGCVPVGTKGEGIDGIIVDGLNGYLVDRDRMIDSLVKIFKDYYGLSSNEKDELRKQAIDTIASYSEEERSRIYFTLVADVLHRRNVI